MADEEISPAQKLAIATNFIINSPPAQVGNVLEDVRTLVGPSVLTPEKEAFLLERVNKEKSMPVTLEDGSQVLLTPHGVLSSGLYLDPSSQCALVVDQKALTATKSPEPLSPAELASLQGAAALRDPIDRAMQQYVSSFFPSGGVCTTYGSTGAGVKVVCCLAGRTQDLSNYWAGLWQSEWTLEVPMGGKVGTLTGKVAVHVHYFEDGNVQLDDKVVFQHEISGEASEAGKEFAAKVHESEGGFMAKLEEIFQNMTSNVLQGLRRRLPITQKKFDWDNLAVAGLAQNLQKAAKMAQ